MCDACKPQFIIYIEIRIAVAQENRQCDNVTVSSSVELMSKTLDLTHEVHTPVVVIVVVVVYEN